MNDKPRLRDAVLQREVEDELLLYNPEDGETLLLNITAASIADLCDGTRDANDIAKVIISVVGSADPDAVRADVEKTLHELQAKGMLERSS